MSLAHVKYLESPGVGIHCVNVKIHSSSSEVTRSQMDFYYLPKNTKFNFNAPLSCVFRVFSRALVLAELRISWISYGFFLRLQLLYVGVCVFF